MILIDLHPRNEPLDWYAPADRWGGHIRVASFIDAEAADEQ